MQMMTARAGNKDGTSLPEYFTNPVTVGPRQKTITFYIDSCSCLHQLPKHFFILPGYKNPGPPFSNYCYTMQVKRNCRRKLKFLRQFRFSIVTFQYPREILPTESLLSTFILYIYSVQ